MESINVNYCAPRKHKSKVLDGLSCADHDMCYIGLYIVT